MRKICVVVASRANYGRVKSVLSAIKDHPNLKLQLIVSASMLLDRYGNAVEVVEKDGFTPDKKIYYMLEGESLATQAKSTGMGIIELSTAFQELEPDVVVTVADRFETMATAIAACYLNIPLAHIQGGEITGNIDETVRHAITKLAHYHFPATEESKKRLLRMGEEEWRVVNSGCPSIDTLVNQDLSIDISRDYIMHTGVGYPVDAYKSYVVLIQHPVTYEYGEGYTQVMKTLEALESFDKQVLVLWPNIDAGSDRVSKALRVYPRTHKDCPIRIYKNFPPEIYNAILANASCVVGNSSSFIRECSFLGTPAVIVGDRQQGREHGKNVMFVDYDSNEIRKAIEKQLMHGKYEKEYIFGDGTAGPQIASFLSEVKLDINKRMSY